MIRIDRILLPTDFSDCAAEATKYARALVDAFDCELHVLYVMENVAAMLAREGVELGELVESHNDQLEEQAIARLAQAIDDEWQRGKQVTLATRVGAPYVEIVRYARDHRVDLIVIGTHGRGILAHALLGSVSERVVRKAPCPVLTVRPGEHEFVLP